MKESTMSRFLVRATMLLFAAAGTACSSGTSSKAQTGQDAATTVIVVNRDADVPTADAPADPDAASAVVPSPDATAADLWMDPSLVFPDCVGTPEEVSDCIINLPTRSGTPVTRPDPMDYSLCRP
jgi:hypothetical protein